MAPKVRKLLSKCAKQGVNCIATNYRFMLRFLTFSLFVLLWGNAALAQERNTNHPDHLDKPYVVLISLDGFRWDYVERFQPPHLSAFIEEGASAEAMIPVYPSKTYPNHYSIATGMHPNQHRLVGNSFYDAEKDMVYGISKRDIVEDGSWYGGTPIWVNAEKQGMVSASYFFVGSEADIQGMHPTYFFPYDGTVPNAARVEQMLDWLRMPPANRPHLIAGYFSDMDDAGHRYGPNDDENIKNAIFRLDEDLGLLFDGVRKLDIPVNIIIVSDHGMAEVRYEQLIPLEALESEEEYLLVSQGALVQLYLKEGVNPEAVVSRLKSLPQAEHYAVYPVSEFPYYVGSPLDPRIGDIIVLPHFPGYFSSARSLGFMKNMDRTIMGEHGYTTDHKEMHGIFYARGPAFGKGATVPAFENIHVYPLICEILGLETPEEVEGEEEVLRPLLKE